MEVGQGFYTGRLEWEDSPRCDQSAFDMPSTPCQLPPHPMHLMHPFHPHYFSRYPLGLGHRWRSLLVAWFESSSRAFCTVTTAALVGFVTDVTRWPHMEVRVWKWSLTEPPGCLLVVRPLSIITEASSEAL